MAHPSEQQPPERDQMMQAFRDIIRTMGGSAELSDLPSRSVAEEAHPLYEDVITLRATDTAGEKLYTVNWLDENQPIIQGNHPLTRMVYEVVERDEQNRPIRVDGSSALFNDYLDYGEESVEQVLQIAEVTAKALKGEEEYEKISFTYDPTTGLLTQIIETKKELGRAETQTVLTNYFDQDGRRIGCIERTREAPKNEGEPESYPIQKMRLFEHGTDGSTEIIYEPYGDHGLVPTEVRVQEPGRLLSDPSYQNVYRTSHPFYPYRKPYIAMHPDGIPLKNSNGDESSFVVMPTLIPVEHAEQVAQGHISLTDATVIPQFPELAGKTLITVDDAIQKAYEQTDERGARSFIQDIVDGTVLVLHDEGLGIRDRMYKTVAEALSGSSIMSETQKVSLFVALHYSFHGLYQKPTMHSKRTSIFLMTLLDLDASRIVSAIDDPGTELGKLDKKAKDLVIKYLSYPKE